MEQTEDQTILQFSRSFEDEGDLPIDIESGRVGFIYAGDSFAAKIEKLRVAVTDRKLSVKLSSVDG